jgi:hypothetical protein
MKNNMFMALATSLLNALALVLTPLFTTPDAKQVLMALTGILSPYISIWLLKVYIRADDPPELTRKIGALKSSIKICKSHLKDSSASEDFKKRTREQLEKLQFSLQTVRDEHGKTTDYSVSAVEVLPPER